MNARPAITGAEVEAAQLGALRELVAELLGANRFYQAKLRAAGVDSPPESLADYSRRFPYTTKQELVEDQEASPPYGTNLTYPLERYTRYNQTSATSGAPLRWLDTREGWQWMVENWMEVFRAAEVGAHDRICFTFSFGPFLGFWTAFEAATQLGCLCLPGGGLSSVARLRMIQQNRATTVCCTPTYALRLAEVAAAEGIDLGASAVRRIIVAGEPGGSVAATRARIESAWGGARVFDHHGMTEVGPVSYECPRRPGCLHVIAPAYFTEIVDPASGEAVPAGAEGELVLTPLNRAGSPLLRYRTGDLARAAEGGCACRGRAEMLLEGGILGRIDDMVTIRGVNVHPGAVEAIVRRIEGIVEYRVEIDARPTLPRLKIQIEPAPGFVNTSGLVTRLQNEMQALLSMHVPVEIVPRDTLPRFEMKARRWIRVESST